MIKLLETRSADEGARKVDGLLRARMVNEADSASEILFTPARSEGQEAFNTRGV